MQIKHPLLTLHEAMASALQVDLPDVAYQSIDYAAEDEMRKKLGAQKLAEHRSTGPRPMVKGVRRPYDQEVSVRVFPQMWGSTALGYGGLGGAAMSTAYTVVVQDDNVACVYFGSGHLGYSVPMRKVTSVQLEAFRADLQQQQLAERRDAVSTYGATLPAGPVRD